MQQMIDAVRSALPDGIKRLVRRIVLDIGGDYRDAYFLAGTHRSGTTWVADVIDVDMRLRSMYEPFNAERVPEVQAFWYGRYIRPDDHDPLLVEPARRILAGKIRHPMVDRHNRRFVFRKRLIKETHANLWLKWLKTEFPELPIVLLLRHPCAVAASKMRLGWPTMLSAFFGQPQLVQDFLAPFGDVAEAARTEFEQHVVNWCVQYYVPFHQLAPSDVHVVFYENLCVAPEAELPALFNFLGARATETAFDALRRPSWSAGPRSAIKSGGSLVDSWRKVVEPSQVKRTVAILERFGLNGVYGEDTMPSAEAATKILSERGLT